MAGFFAKIVDKFFGDSPKDENALPDDGGLGEFAKQYAKMLAEEEKNGKAPVVSANTILKVQQGKFGTNAYLLDSHDFKKAIAKELRDSVPPVIEGILKSRCGEKGKGFMNVLDLYVFSIKRNDPCEEYNAAMDLIDDIGMRLLGERYKKGDRRINIPVAKVASEDLFKADGTINFEKAKETINWVRETKTHGPLNVDWQTGEMSLAEGDPNWIPNEVRKIEKIDGEWQTFSHHPKMETLENKQWQTIEKQKPKEQAKPAAKLVEQAPSSLKPKTADLVSEPVHQNESNQPIRIDATDLKQLGQLTLAFRPTWHAHNESINAYAGCVYRKVATGILSGEQVYPDDLDPSTIAKIDEAIAKQAALHLQHTQQLDEKTIILPFHLKSLSIIKEESPIKALRELDESLRKSVWIEVVGVGSNASPSRIAGVIEAHRDCFNTFGIRFELGDVSRSLIERSKANFLSCDVAASSAHGLQMRTLDQDLPDLRDMAKNYNMSFCTWGLRNRDDLMVALREGSGFINGHALAKEMRKPGRVIPVPAAKLVAH